MQKFSRFILQSLCQGELLSNWFTRLDFVTLMMVSLYEGEK